MGEGRAAPPIRDKVLLIGVIFCSFGHLFVCSAVCLFVLWAIQPGLGRSQPDLMPSQPSLKPEAWLAGLLGLRSGWLGLKYGWLGLKPDWLGLKSDWLALRPGWMAQRGEQQKKGQRDRTSPHATGVCPLSGPLPKNKMH